MTEPVRAPYQESKIEDEVGDLFFVLVNMARYLNVDPEAALRRTNRKFRSRFGAMEAAAHAAGRKLDGMPIEELESLWQQAKGSAKTLPSGGAVGCGREADVCAVQHPASTACPANGGARSHHPPAWRYRRNHSRDIPDASARRPAAERQVPCR